MVERTPADEYVAARDALLELRERRFEIAEAPEMIEALFQLLGRTDEAAFEAMTATTAYAEELLGR